MKNIILGRTRTGERNNNSINLKSERGKERFGKEYGTHGVS